MKSRKCLYEVISTYIQKLICFPNDMHGKSCLLATKISGCKREIMNFWDHFQIFLYRLVIYTANLFLKDAIPRILCNPALEYFWEIKSKNEDENCEACLYMPCTMFTAFSKQKCWDSVKCPFLQSLCFGNARHGIFSCQSSLCGTRRMYNRQQLVAEQFQTQPRLLHIID